MTIADEKAIQFTTAKQAWSAKHMLAGAQELTVDNVAQLEGVSMFARSVSTKRKEIDAERKAVTQPLNAAVKRINGWFKPALETLQATEDHCRKLIGDYHLRQKAEQDRQFREAQEAMASGNVDGASEALASSSAAAPGKAAGTSARVRWRAVVRDAGLVPREFLQVNLAALDAVARAVPADEQPTPIPGVEFVPEAHVTLRRIV
jgi:hypothetical protein